MERESVIKKLQGNYYKYRLRKVIVKENNVKKETCYLVTVVDGNVVREQPISKNLFGKIDKRLYKLNYNDEDVKVDTHIPLTLPVDLKVVYDYIYDIENTKEDSFIEEQKAILI